LTYLRSTDGSDPVRLGEGRALALSPDSETALVRGIDGKLQVVPTGAGQPRTVNPPGRLHDACGILPTGRLVCWAQDPNGSSRLYLEDGNGNWKAVSPEYGEARAAFEAVPSPSGDRVAAHHADRLYLLDVASANLTPVVGWPSGYGIAGWTADSQSLYLGR